MIICDMVTYCVKELKLYIYKYIFIYIYKINAHNFKQHTQWQSPLSNSPWKCCAQKHLNMTQIFIIPDHHHKSHPVKTFSVRKYVNHDIVQHHASEHSRVSGKTCSDPRALQSQSFIKHYSCILRFLSVALLIETWVIWQASLHNTIVWITEPTWEPWGEMSFSLSLWRDWDSKQS